MRMRFKPYARPELLACDFHVHEPLTHAGHWHELYARPEQPLHLELGCGKGGFLSQLAPLHPDINYLGIDITDKVLILAKRKVEAAYAAAQLPPDNVKIASLDIERLSGVFSPADTVQRIYINFCNPWSKNAGSNKHRLTHPRQLLQYRALMPEGSEIYFKPSSVFSKTIKDGFGQEVIKTDCSAMRTTVFAILLQRTANCHTVAYGV